MTTKAVLPCSTINKAGTITPVELKCNKETNTWDLKEEDYTCGPAPDSSWFMIVYNGEILD